MTATWYNFLIFKTVLRLFQRLTFEEAQPTTQKNKVRILCINSPKCIYLWRTIATALLPGSSASKQTPAVYFHSVEIHRPHKLNYLFKSLLLTQFCSLKFYWSFKVRIFLLKVFLGDPHVCNCSTFLKGGELCKHICW